MSIVYDRLKYRSDTINSLFVNKLFGYGQQLKKYLKTYPEYMPPHAGLSAQLLTSQAEENYEYFEQEKPKRIALVQELLSRFSVHIDYYKPDRHTLMLLDAWAYQQWSSIYHSSLVNNNVYSFSCGSKQRVVRSLLFDLGILLGECYLSLQDQAHWFLDIRTYAKENQLSSYNRVVIKPYPTEQLSEDDYHIIDMEAQVFFHYGLQNKSAPIILADQKIGRVLAEPVLALLSDEQ